jgi:hypothetical protein
MTQKIIAFSGVKQSGKTTCVNFLHGYQLVKHGLIDDFGISPEGELFVEATEDDKKGGGMIDVFRTDEEFVSYASANIWPFIKCYNFADPLKHICVNLFGLGWHQCFGSDKDKNSKIDLKWKDLPRAGMKKGNLTAREFMQYFGTNICRKIKPDIWTQACISRVQSEQSELSVIGDCRFENEVDVIKKAGGKVVRLTRQIFEDSHLSETALNKDKFDWENFDLIIDNQNMSIEETHDCLLENIQKWGW